MNVAEAISSLAEIIAWEEKSPPVAYAQSVRLFEICYRSDECKVIGYISVPLTLEERVPAVIFNRGGNREFGLLRPDAVCRLADRGFVALGSQYRGNAGGTGREQFGGKDVNDVIALIDMCGKLPFVKQGGVYMQGHSRGGMMTYLCCARDNRIKAAAVGAGLADCFTMYETREQSMKDVFHELVGGSPAQVPEAFRARSAVCWADKIIPPILICQGTADTRVIPRQSCDMAQALKAAKKECKLIIYGKADHSLVGTAYIDDVVQWFREHPF